MKRGIPTPLTQLAFTEESAIKAINELGLPIVLKPVIGSWGRLSALIKDIDSARAIIECREHMFSIYRIYYLQRFVKRPPRDIRSFVIGGRTVASIYRIAAPGEWRTNTARGGKAKKCEITNEIDDLSVKAAEAVGGEVVGVDLMESEDGLLVHEVNNTVEFKNTVPATGVDIPSIIVDYMIGLQKR